MESNIKPGRIFGVEIGLRYTWILIALLIAFSLAARFQAARPDWRGGVAWLTAIITAALFFASIIVDELSHAMVAKMRGLPVNSINGFSRRAARASSGGAKTPGRNYARQSPASLTTMCGRRGWPAARRKARRRPAA